MNPPNLTSQESVLASSAKENVGVPKAKSSSSEVEELLFLNRIIDRVKKRDPIYDAI